jgi:D-alanine-D-alanine ligase-like ATP-grasp enzyme
VTGDGIHTIAELIDIKNMSRHPLVSAVELSDVHIEFLAASGQKVGNVLPKGTEIDLIEKIGVSYGGTSADDTTRTHPETIRIIEKAGEVLSDPLIGIDFIIPDIEKAPAEQKWGITECNACPFINLHHDPVEGESRNVAGAVWDMITANIDCF